MALRFSITQFSVKNVVYHLYIYDNEFTGESTQLEGSFKIKYSDVDYQNPFQAIITSATDITVHVRNTDTEFETFIEELAGADELRYIIEVRRNGSLKWRGHLITDIVSIPDQSYTYDVTLAASDGLTRLKNIEYRKTDNTIFEGIATLAEHFVNCIKRIGFPNISTDVILNTYGFRWVEINQAITEAIVDKIAVQHALFQRYGKYPDYICLSCWEVLETLLNAFNARIYANDGIFVIQQLNEGHTTLLCQWQYNGVLKPSSFLDRRKNITTERSDGNFTFYPRIREAVSTYKLKNYSLTPIIMPVDQNVSLGNFTGSGNQFKIDFRLRCTWNYQIEIGCFAMFRLGISIGGEAGISLRGRYSQVFGNIPMHWEGNMGYYYILTPYGTHFGSNVTEFSVITPAFNQEGEGLARFDLLGLYQTLDVTAPANENFNFEVEIFNITQFHAESEGSLTPLTYKGISMKPDGITPISTSVVEKMSDTIIGDGPQYSKTRISVINSQDYYVDSALWKPYTGYTGESISLHKLRLLEFIGMKKYNIKVFDFTLEDYCEFINTIVFEGSEYLILTYELNPDLDNVALSTLRLNIDRSDIQLIDPVPEETYSGGGGGGSIGGGSPTAEYNYWVRNETNNMLSPKSGEDVNLNGRYVIGSLITDTVQAKDEAGLIQFRNNDRDNTVFLEFDTGKGKAKLAEALAVGAGESDPQPISTFEIRGSKGDVFYNFRPTNISGALTLNGSHYNIMCDTTLYGGTIALPQASTVPLRVYHIRLHFRPGSYNITIDPYSTESLRGSAGSYQTLALDGAGEWVTLQSIQTPGGTTWEWNVIASNPNF